MRRLFLSALQPFFQGFQRDIAEFHTLALSGCVAQALAELGRQIDGEDDDSLIHGELSIPWLARTGFRRDGASAFAFAFPLSL